MSFSSTFSKTTHTHICARTGMHALTHIQTYNKKEVPIADRWRKDFGDNKILYIFYFCPGPIAADNDWTTRSNKQTNKHTHTHGIGEK